MALSTSATAPWTILSSSVSTPGCLTSSPKLTIAPQPDASVLDSNAPREATDRDRFDHLLVLDIDHRDVVGHAVGGVQELLIGRECGSQRSARATSAT